MRPNQSRAILIFVTTPSTTWLFAGYAYTTEAQKATKVSNKNSFFNWLPSLYRELMNASYFTNLFTNSCDHICTNGKAPLHPHINHNTPQILYSLWRRANARNVSFLNLYKLVWENQIFVLQRQVLLSYKKLYSKRNDWNFPVNLCDE